MERLKKCPTIGVCGLDCGLCPRYYTAGISRCPGCGGPGFSDKHPSCSFITCCVKKRHLEVCGECPEFVCSKFKSEEEYRLLESSSYPPSRKMLSNLGFIKEKGIREFTKCQAKRIRLLGAMIAGYDAGRSRSFFCRAAALLDPDVVKGSLAKAKKSIRSSNATSDTATRSKILRSILAEAALGKGIDLKGK